MAILGPAPVIAGRSLAPYERLIKLLEYELELAGNGQVHELAEALAQRSEFLRTLPYPAPPEAEPLLLRARALHSRLSIETQRLAESITRRRGARRLARTMARRYVPPPHPANYSTSV